MQLGDGDLKAGKYNMALMRRAIREKWPISNEVRQQIIEQMAKIATSKGGRHRDKVAAAKVLVAADQVNARRESTQADSDRPPPPAAPPATVNVQVVNAIQDADEAKLAALEEKINALLDGTTSTDGTATQGAGSDPPSDPRTPRRTPV